MKRKKYGYFAQTIFEGTYAEIADVVARSRLKMDSYYVITDNTDAEGGQIVLTPISLTRFSQFATYIPAGNQNLEWSARYSFDDQALVELEDHLSNVVKGNGAINSFPWMDANVTGNYINNPETFSYLAGTGTFHRNTVHAGASVSITNNDGQIEQNIISGSLISVDNQAGGMLIENTIAPSGTLWISGYNNGAVSWNSIHRSKLQLVANDANVWDNFIQGNSNLIINASSAPVTENHISASSMLTINENGGGTIEQNSLRGSVAVTISKDTGNVRNNDISGDSILAINNSGTDTNFNQNVLQASSSVTLTLHAVAVEEQTYNNVTVTLP